MTTLHTQTLPSKTAALVELLQNQNTAFSFLSSFYLSGGTALSLQIGHRESEDLDFFSQTSFKPEQVQRELQTIGQLTETQLATGTLNTFLNGVKLQFLEYPYNLIEPTQTWKQIAISSVADIACTKLQTIGMRGSKKDFVDLFFLFDLYSLPQLFALVDTKYPQADYSKMHILKSLVYFNDAETQPMPRMIKTISWEEVKQKMITVTQEFSFK